MSRTRRAPYRKAKAFDRSCRSHGGCPYCEGSRNHKNAKRILSTRDQLRELNIRKVAA